MQKADREDEEEFNEHGAKRQNSSHQRSVTQRTLHTPAHNYCQLLLAYHMTNSIHSKRGNVKQLVLLHFRIFTVI